MRHCDRLGVSPNSVSTVSGCVVDLSTDLTYILGLKFGLFWLFSVVCRDWVLLSVDEAVNLTVDAFAIESLLRLSVLGLFVVWLDLFVVWLG